MTDAEQPEVASDQAQAEAPPASMPDYLLEPNAVLLDQCRWRHGQVRPVCQSQILCSFLVPLARHMLRESLRPSGVDPDSAAGYRSQITARQMQILKKVSTTSMTKLVYHVLLYHGLLQWNHRIALQARPSVTKLAVWKTLFPTWSKTGKRKYRTSCTQKTFVQLTKSEHCTTCLVMFACCVVTSLCVKRYSVQSLQCMYFEIDVT